jgi:hypothetical protein
METQHHVRILHLQVPHVNLCKQMFKHNKYIVTESRRASLARFNLTPVYSALG